MKCIFCDEEITGEYVKVSCYVMHPKCHSSFATELWEFENYKEHYEEADTKGDVEDRL